MIRVLNTIVFVICVVVALPISLVYWLCNGSLVKEEN